MIKNFFDIILKLKSLRLEYICYQFKKKLQKKLKYFIFISITIYQIKFK